MRVFVALDVAAPVRARVAAATRPLRQRHPELNWTPPASWHVTLAFLGEVDETRGDEVRAAVAAGIDHHGGGALQLRLGPPGHFGHRVAWLGVGDDPHGGVAALGAAIQAAVAEAGLPVERRDVHPHVTLARARGRRGRLSAQLLDELPHVEGRWRSDAATILRSHLGAGPVRYEPIATVSLT